MKNIFQEKEVKEEKPAQVLEETELKGQKNNQVVTKELVEKSIKHYVETEKTPQSLKIVLAKPFKLKANNVLEFPIDNKVEISMMQNSEVELLKFLRRELSNSDISIDYEIREDNTERKPYTNSEVFQAMVKKNPALIKLKESLGLDTDY